MKYLSAGNERQGSSTLDDVQVDNIKPFKRKSPERQDGPSEQQKYSQLRQKSSGGYTKYPERKKDILISTKTEDQFDKQITKAHSVMSRAKSIRPEFQESRTVRAAD